MLALMTSHYGAYFEHMYKSLCVCDIDKCDFHVYTFLLGSLHIIRSHANMYSKFHNHGECRKNSCVFLILHMRIAGGSISHLTKI